MRKSILFIIWTFSGGGGAEKILANLVNNLDLNKYDIDILEYRNYGNSIPRVKNGVNILKPITRDSPKINQKISNRVHTILLYKIPYLLRSIKIKKKYDIEIGFNYLIPQMLLSRSRNVKKLGWFHGSIEHLMLDNKKDKKLYKIQRKVMKNLDSVIAISKKTQKSIEEVYPEFIDKVEIINNGYIFNFDKPNREVNREKIRIVSIGRLDENKNHVLLIESVNILKNFHDNIEVFILGEGKLKKSLVDKIIEYKLDDIIKMEGYIKYPQEYLMKSDILAVTSKAEGFPTVIIEAMECGVPFVSTDVGGVEELSNGNKCGLISDSNPKRFAETLNELILDKRRILEMSKNCREYVKSFGVEKQLEKIENLFGRS